MDKQKQRKREREREIVFSNLGFRERENEFGLKNFAKFVKLRRLDKLIVTITRDG